MQDTGSTANPNLRDIQPSAEDETSPPVAAGMDWLAFAAEICNPPRRIWMVTLKEVTEVNRA